MADRFYYEGNWSEVVTLSGSESQHLSKVLRKQVGEIVELFDGKGARVECAIKSISKRDVQLKLNSEPQFSERIDPRVTLAVAPPKGDRFRWLVEKVTELGVAQIIPIQSERSIVRPGEAKLKKLRQTMISACKQCRRDHFMEILPFTELKTLPETHDISTMMYYGDVLPQDAATPYSKTSCVNRDSIAFVGPEGGFSPTEIELLESWGAKPLSAAPHVLRIETAAIALASLLISSQTR